MQCNYSDVWQAVARECGERPAVVTRDSVTSYAQWAAQAGAVAARLASAGLRPGDAVAILSYNRPEFLTVLFACFASGLAPVPLNYRYRPAEVEALLHDSEARALVFPTSLGETALRAAATLDPPALLLSFDDGGAEVAGAERFADVLGAGGTLPATAPPDGELRLYTGGTTGTPKSVAWGAADIFEVQQYPTYGAIGLPTPHSMDDAVRVASDPSRPPVVTLPLTPFMHGTALFNTMNTLVLGGTVVLHASPRLDADEAVRLAIDTGVTRLIVAGDAVTLPLVEAAERAEIERFESVTSAVSSGMRFGDDVKRRLHALGDIEIMDLLASSEGGPYAVNATRSAADLPGRLKLLPDAVVLDANHREVQNTPGSRGLIAFRGRLPKGYRNDPVKTTETFPVIGGVRHVIPGDWALVLGDGFIGLLGRGSAVVNTGGEKVYPAEVEDALLTHPHVRDVVVFGMPDARFGEQVTAVVVPETGATLDPEQVRAHLKQLLAGYKVPRRIVVRDSLERSPHGKVELARLKADLA